MSYSGRKSMALKHPGYGLKVTLKADEKRIFEPFPQNGYNPGPEARAGNGFGGRAVQGFRGVTTGTHNSGNSSVGNKSRFDRNVQ